MAYKWKISSHILIFRIAPKTPSHAYSYNASIPLNAGPFPLLGHYRPSLYYFIVTGHRSSLHLQDRAATHGSSSALYACPAQTRQILAALPINLHRRTGIATLVLPSGAGLLGVLAPRIRVRELPLPLLLLVLARLAILAFVLLSEGL